MSTAAEFAPTEGRCHCGHYRWHHYLRGCESLHDYRADGRRNKRTRGKPCPCPGFDDSVLPADGERLEFGRHRLSARVAESAPAWPALGDEP